MSCKEVTTKKYQSRASPPFHAKDCKNLTKKGKADTYAYYYGFKDFETGERINCFDKYRTNLPKRKACEKEHRAILIKRLKGAVKPMKGFKMIQKRGFH